MDQLVHEEAATGDGARLVATGCEPHVVADSEGLGVDGVGQLGRPFVGVDTDGAQVVAQHGLEVAAHVVGDGDAGRREPFEVGQAGDGLLRLRTVLGVDQRTRRTAVVSGGGRRRRGRRRHPVRSPGHAIASSESTGIVSGPAGCGPGRGSSAGAGGHTAARPS